MSIANKCGIVLNDARVVWSILANTGIIPPSRKSMITLELCSVCNLRCPLCPTGLRKTTRRNQFMPLSLFNRILEMTRPVAQGYVLGMWGEPMLYPHLEEVLSATAPLPAWTSTNLNFTERRVRELAKWKHFNIVCAIDTLDSEAYPEYRRGGDYDTVLRNIDILSEGECQVYPQFLVDAGDDDDTPYVEFADRHNIPRRNVIIKIKRENFTLAGRDKVVPGKCHSPYNGLYFNSDGDLFPCCNDVRKDLVVKNIAEIDSLENILSGPEMRELRRRLARDKNQFPSCRACRGETLWNVRLPVYTEYVRNLLPWRKDKRRGPQHMPFEE